MDETPGQSLSSFERGAVAAALSCAGDDGPAVLARLVPFRCAGAVVRLRASSCDERADFVAQTIAATRRGVPDGLERIHPEWVERSLAGVSREVADVIVGTVGDETAGRCAIPAPVVLWLRHHAFAGMVDMPTGRCPAPASMTIGDLPALPHRAVIRVLRRVGATQVAWALFDAGPGAIARVARAFGGSGRAVTAAATELTRWIDEGRDPAAFHGPARDAQSRLADLDEHDALDDVSLFRVGCRALAPRVSEHGGDLGRQIAQRMPCRSGLQALSELHGVYGQMSPDRTVRWSVIADCVAACTVEGVME